MNLMLLKAKAGVAVSMLWVMLKKYVKSPHSWPVLGCMSVILILVIIPNMFVGNFAPALFALVILPYDFRAVMALIALQNTLEIDCEVYSKAIDMIFDEEN